MRNFETIINNGQGFYRTDRFLHIPINHFPMTPHVVILCGIPTAGKSTWSKNNRIQYRYPGDDFRSYVIISRDKIRLEHFNQPYFYSKNNENKVTEIFNDQLAKAMSYKRPIILDNTHCKESYLKEALKRFENTDYSVKVKFFDLPLWKAYYRNIKRKIQTGVWIPVKVIKQMKKNYDKINKSNYAQYSY